MTPANLCRACGLDFASLAAFDRHHVGTHEYAASPERPEGRRCLTVSELPEAGMEKDERGRWRLELTEARKASLAALSVPGLRAKQSSQDATEAAA